MLSQKNLDQGDTAQRIGLFYALTGLMDEHQDYRGYELKYGLWGDLRALTAGGGRYRRSPNGGFWGYDPDCLSRDNHAMLMMAMAVNGLTIQLKETWHSILNRFGFYQNKKPGTDAPPDYTKVPDIITPHDISRYVRGMSYWWAYPAACVLDLGFLVDLILRRKQLWDYDNMMAINLMYAVSKYPTPAGLLAWHIYKRTDFLDRIKHYYSEDNGANGLKPLGELYEQCFNYLIKTRGYL